MQAKNSWEVAENSRECHDMELSHPEEFQFRRLGVLDKNFDEKGSTMPVREKTTLMDMQTGSDLFQRSCWQKKF